VHRAAPRPALRVGDVIRGVNPCGSSRVPSNTSTRVHYIQRSRGTRRRYRKVVTCAGAMALAELRRCRLGPTGAVPSDEAEGLTGSRLNMEAGTAGHAAAAASSRAWESTHVEGSPGAEPVLSALDSSTNITAQPEAAAEKAGEWRLIMHCPAAGAVSGVALKLCEDAPIIQRCYR